MLPGSVRSLIIAASVAALAGAGVVAAPLAASAVSSSPIQITEFAYGGKFASSGPDGEYVEITNRSASTVSTVGWTFTTDASPAPTPIGLDGFVSLAAGESAIITDISADDFRAEWGLVGSVKIINNGSTNLNSGPRKISILDGDGAVADSVSYAKNFFGGKGQSAWVDAAHAGAKSDTTGWTISTSADSEGSWTSAKGSIGSPGASTLGTSTPTSVRTSTGGGTTTPPPTDPANYKDIVINEVSSDNDSLGFAPLPALRDGIELYNKGTSSVDLTGWKQTDSDPTHAPADFSGGLYVDGALATTIPAGHFGVFQSTQGLGSDGDSVKIYTAAGTLVDHLDFLDGQAGVGKTVNTDHKYQAIASCGDGTQHYLEVRNASFGAANTAACVNGVTPLTSGAAPEAPCETEDSGTAPGTIPAGALPWPGGGTPKTIDGLCAWDTKSLPGGSGNDLSGLAFDPNDGNVLYAVKNKSHVWRLLKVGETWTPDAANGWAAGKELRFTDGGGAPDTEGMTVGPDGFLYITTERDNNNGGVPLDSILRYDPSSAATTLVATDQWVLTPDLGLNPATDANLGFEGVAYVPDSFLTGAGFRTDAGTLYKPADYPGKALPGLFLAAVEKTGHLIAYVLNTDHSYVRVADISSGMAGVMDAQFDDDLGRVWAHCDNTCGNATALMKIGTDGHFAVEHYYATPANLPNYNLEGFAVAPLSSAVNGQRQVLWSDDGNRFGHSLWAGYLSVPVISPSTSTPAPGDSITLTVSGLTPGTEYQAVLHSTPVLLGSGTANASGVLTLTVTIPSSTTPGAHTITIAAVSDPNSTLAVIALTVAGAALAETGVTPGAGIVAAIVLLLLGAGALAAVRRRRRAAR
jgi:hypothetical protein